MSALAIGWISIGAGMALMAAGFPIGVALGSVSFIGIWMITSETAAWGMLTAIPYNFAGSWDLSAVPMFLFMGFIAANSGLHALGRPGWVRLQWGLSLVLMSWAIAGHLVGLRMVPFHEQGVLNYGDALTRPPHFIVIANFYVLVVGAVLWRRASKRILTLQAAIRLWKGHAA